MAIMEMAVLGSTGHMDLKWDPKNVEDTAKAKAEFERMAGLGYAFFVTGAPHNQDERVKTWDELTGALEAVYVGKKDSKLSGGPRAGKGARKAAVAVPPMAGG